jgi:hypothetical protein
MGSSSRVLGNIINCGHAFYGLARSGSLERAIAISTLVERAKAAKTENGIRGSRGRNLSRCAPECGGKLVE